MIELNKKEINKLKALFGVKEHQGEKLVRAQVRAAQGKVKIKLVREAK